MKILFETLTYIFICNLFVTVSNGIHNSESIYSGYGQEEELLPTSAKLTDASCSFPSRWIGTWFQSGVHVAITINETSINIKGRCIKADGDKFIVFNPSDHCYRCVVLHEKHKNVLQYKETYCNLDPSGLSLQSICRTIQGDALLYSMFRLNADPIPCPFIGSYTFTYNRGSGECHSPVSTIDTCNRLSRLVLNYQACYDVPGTESAVEELECLASWREGSSRYMVGLMQYQHPSSFEERFRCFVYEKENRFGSSSGSFSSYNYPGLSKTNFSSSSSSLDNDKVVFHVAQSGDATCLGVTALEGSTALTLRRATPIPTPCLFPNWMQVHTQWLSLNQEISYAFEDSTLRIMNVSSSQMPPEENKLITTAVCTKYHENPMENKATIILRSTTECKIGYMCVSVYLRDGHILELQKGKLARNIENACHISNFDETTLPYTTLTSPTPETRECPFVGEFDISGSPKDLSSSLLIACPRDIKGSILIGCGSLDSLHLNTYCSNVPKLTDKYTCNGWWEESGDTYLIVTSSSSISNPHQKIRSCFKITEQEIELTPQELRRKQSRYFDYDEDEDSNGSKDLYPESKKLFKFSNYLTNCYRGTHEDSINLQFQVNSTSQVKCTSFSSGTKTGSSITSQAVTYLLILQVLKYTWSLIY